ncbi:MAG TPA: ABC transporter permease [Bacillus sp. (in: firmicutes)]
MFDEKLLWKERFGRTSKELSRYLRYIFNGHLVIVFVFLIGTAAYYYQEWLKTLQETFPSAIIMSVCIAILLTYSPIYTFMSEADRIFLLPLETKLSGYFRKSFLISFSLQVYLLLIGLAVLMPMYAAVNQGNFKRFFPFLIAILIVKVLNLLIRWHVQYYGEVHVLSIDSLIRFLVNLVFLYLLFSNAAIYLSIIAAALLFGLYVYYKQQTKDKGLKWEFLIEQDESRLTSFYRLANLFTDVPKLKNQVKRRKWLDSLLVRISFQQDNAFTYLFTRTFLRSGDYWGLFVRLSVIGAGAIYFLTFGIGQVIMAVVFIYLTGFQLLPLWKHHQYHSMLELYPLSESRKEFSFLSFLRKVLFSQSILFALVLFVKGEFAVACITLLVCIVFSLYFVSIYTKRKIKG